MKKLWEKITANHKVTNNTSESSRTRRTGDDWADETSSSHEQRADSGYNFKIGIYGWRKRCLYLLILGLLVMVIINLALTLWVLKVMEFSSEGMGQLRIVAGGLQLNGQAMVLDALIASTIRSRKDQPITIESSRNLTLSTRDRNGLLVNRLFLGNDRFECLSRGFRVVDDRDNVLFSADKHEVVIGAEMLRVTGVGGVVFDGSVQTPLVRAEPAQDLRLESPTRSLELRAPMSIGIDARAGSITATCLTDLKLNSVAGSIKLEAPTILMPSLPTTRTSGAGTSSSTRSSSSSSSNHQQDIYQLCVCEDGRLFLAPPHGVCSADETSGVCR